jgi:hypothetical protein
MQYKVTYVPRFLIVALLFFQFSYSQTNCESARKEYLEKNPDVKKAGIDPWTHFIYYGKNEGRVWSPCVEDENSKIITEEDMKILFGEDNTNKSYYDVYKLGNKGVENGFGVLEFSNADVYRGNFIGGKQSGYGEYYFTNGDVYKGEFADGKFQGNGKYYYNNGDVKDAVWENGNVVQQISYQWGSQKSGGCVSGNCVNGKGKFIYSNGEYEGDFVNSLKQGNGKFTSPNGDVYEGQYTNGQRNGYGIFSFANGKRYEGYFSNGFREGIGTFYYLDGGRYEGSWLANERSGQGIYYYPNGNVYSGSWYKHKKSGQGKLVFSSGLIQEGLFENDNFVSQNSSSNVALSTQNTTPITSTQTNNSTETVIQTCTYKFTKPTNLSYKYIDNRVVCCYCKKYYAEYEEQSNMVNYEQAMYISEKLYLHQQESGSDESHRKADNARLVEFLTTTYPGFENMGVIMAASMASAMFPLYALSGKKLGSTVREIEKYKLTSDFCSPECKDRCGYSSSCKCD